MVPMVQLNALATLAVKLILVEVPLQMDFVAAVITAGLGFTVTVIVEALPAHEPAVEVGVTRYCTVPAVELLGLVNVWLIVVPEPALAPVILPVMVPMVQLNALATLAVKLILVEVPLQMDFVAAVVTAGLGFTVTVIVEALPAHEPAVEVGVTRYCTVPAVELLGLVNVWLIVVPEPALAPVILPVMVPMVQLNALATLAVKLILVEVPLQMDFVAAVVTAGLGFTVTVIVEALPAHEPAVEVGVTRYCTVPAVELLGLVNVWLIVVPEPALAPVILPVMVPMVQLNALATLAVKLILVEVPLQMDFVAAVVTAGLGFTVTVIVEALPAHEPAVEVGVTRYCTVPAVELLGLVNVWLIVVPEPALAPVIPPVMVPMVQLNELAALAVKLILGPVPLQVLAVLAVVTRGFGLIVTVIVKGLPGQEPVVEVGVTIYSTVPAVVLLGFVSV